MLVDDTRTKMFQIAIVIIIFILYINAIEKNNSLIYMLMWTQPEVLPFTPLEMGLNYLINKKCLFQNCFVTSEKSYFQDVRDFDVLLFYISNIEVSTIPPKRSERQKYVFISGESPIHFGVENVLNGFFNLTWTYKLNSDATWRYFVVRNRKGEIIGPKTQMHWKDIKSMKPTSNYIKQKLRNKSIAAAWFVSHCETTGRREIFYRRLHNEIIKYNLKIDVFGECGDLKCDYEECYALLESDYYFYLSFENSFGEDYVTEKVLTAIEHFAVPVVYGGANYTRFMPDGMYLNALALEVEKLAKIMNDSIHDKNKYYDFFRWHRYYSFHDPRESPDSDEICSFCAFLNDKNEMNRSSVHTDITDFWYNG